MIEVEGLTYTYSRSNRSVSVTRSRIASDTIGRHLS